MRVFFLGFAVALGCSDPLVSVRDAGAPTSDAAPTDAPPAIDAGLAADAAVPDAGFDLGPPPAPRDPELEPCWPGRFCWLEGAAPTWIDGADETSVHVVDRSGRVFRRDGTAWTELPGIEARRVSRIYVASRDDVWALAEHVDEPGWFVDRFDGRAWTTSWPAADGTYLGGYGDEVWTREAESHAFLRHDDEGWHSVPPIDERFGTLAMDGHQSSYDPAILPGPDATAYAITHDVVPLVLRHSIPEGWSSWDARWEVVGALAGGGNLGWSDGEIRVVESWGSGADSAELRFDGRRWVPVRTAPEGRYLVPTRHGIQTNVEGGWCRLELFTGVATYCADGEGRLVRRTETRDAPVWTASWVPEPVRPFSASLFADVSPAYWAGAHTVIGSVGSYVRLPRSELTPRERWSFLEEVHGDAVTPVLAEGMPVTSTLLAGNAAGEIFASDHRLLRGVRARGTTVLFPVPLADDSEGRPTWGVTAVESTPDGAWAVAQNRVYRIGAERAVLDAELPFADFTDSIDLVDVDVTDGDVWLAAAIGHRSRQAALFHREVDARGETTYRRVMLGGGFWGLAHLERRGETLVVVLPTFSAASVLVLPIADLAGAEPARPIETYAVTDTPPPGFYAESFEAPELWVDEGGAWLSSGARTLWLPLP